MKLKLNESNYIVGYATKGEIENSIEIKNDLFYKEFNSQNKLDNIYYYKFENNKFIYNENKKQEIITEENNRINLMKAYQYLKDTDYIIIQVLEGISKRTDEEINIVKQKREECRELIRSRL